MLSPSSLPGFSPSSVPAPSLGEVSVQSGFREQEDTPMPSTSSISDRNNYARSSLSSVVEEPDLTCQELQSPPCQPQSPANPTSTHNSNPSNAHASSTHPPLAALVDLPMIHVTIPHPSEMNLLHGWLYNPSPPLLLSALLDLPKPTDDGQSHPPAVPTIPQRLSALPVRSILERMQRTHRVWGNVVAFGIADPTLWKVMDRAWDILVDTLKNRGGESVREVALFESQEMGEGLEVHNEVVRKFSMATIRDPRSRAGSATSD